MQGLFFIIFSVLGNSRYTDGKVQKGEGGGAGQGWEEEEKKGMGKDFSS